MTLLGPLAILDVVVDRAAVLWMAAAALACCAACHPGDRPALGPPACLEAVCVTPRELERDDVTDIVALDVAGPLSLRLTNAALRYAAPPGAPAAGGAPCATGAPLAALSVDGMALPHGPAAVGGAHRLRLRFPHLPPPEGPPQPPVPVVDLDLALDGRARCQSVVVMPREGRR